MIFFLQIAGKTVRMVVKMTYMCRVLLTFPRDFMCIHLFDPAIRQPWPYYPGVTEENTEVQRDLFAVI